MSKYGKGCHPSPPDARDWRLHRLGAIRAADVKRVVSYKRFIEDVYSQWDTSSCTGWGSTRGWHIRARIQGDMTVKYPSAWLTYAEGLAAMAGDPNVPLIDDGCWARLTLLGMKELGCVPLEQYSDPNLRTVRPDWGTLRESADRREVQFARVYGTDEMISALAMGHPLVVGFSVDQSFEDYTGGVWDGMRGDALGGHCTCILAHDLDAPVPNFTGVNSWGADYGEDGCYRISKRYIDSLPAFEAWAVNVVNADPSEAA